MKTALDILDRVESIGSTNEKIRLLSGDGFEGDPQELSKLKNLVTAALNYKRLYYIKKLPPVVESEFSDNPQWYEQFMDTILPMCEASGRTHDTKDRVDAWLCGLSTQAAKWCRRIVLRDLKCGVSTELANKAGYDIPVFEVQLATDGKKCKKLSSLIKNGLYLSPKFDGYRCFAIIRDGHVELYSRNGTTFQNFPSVEEAVLRKFGWAGDMCYDGEIMSNDFNSMQRSAFAHKRGTTVGDVKYHIFGSVPLAEWDTQSFTTPYFENRARLEKIFYDSAVTGDDPLSLVPVKSLPRESSLEDIVSIEREMIAAGFEGVMANPGDLPYSPGKKANNMLKFKTMLTWDCEIVGFYAGKPESKRDGKLGGVIVKQENGELCEVGSGFDDEDLDYIWQEQDHFLGRICEVAYQELTVPDQKMRFPVFKKWRPDKS